METHKRTPMQLFTLPQHFNVPLFQRTYVWEEAEQWAPLWKDIKRTVHTRLQSPHLSGVSHFLGAVVLQSNAHSSGNLTAWNVIDGQQRLTTLQLLIDATQTVFTGLGFSRQANRLANLTHNSSDFIHDGDSTLKVRHMNKDRAAFDEVMNAPAPVNYSELVQTNSRFARAHQFFAESVTEWLAEVPEGESVDRIETLTEVLQHGIQLVSIDLLPTEDSQEIFETLNARGTPLTVADMIRNFVFQRLELEGSDSKRAYEAHWPFEKKFWEKEVSIGRQSVSRSSVFLNQWLQAKLGEEISPPTTFGRFKAYVEHDPEITVSQLLPQIKLQADLYQAWTEAAARPDGNLSPIEMSFYRMRAGNTEVLKPLILWLTDPNWKLPSETIEQVIAAAESWVYRRFMLRLTISDLGRIVADLINDNKNANPDELDTRVTAQLSRLNASSTYWPGDDEIRSFMLPEPTYTRYPRPRLRMFLEAIEDRYRSETKQPQVQRSKLPIEHIMPQTWRETWPVGTPDEEALRQGSVHKLGNLTLLTTALNSKVSNSSWSKKHEALLAHNTISMTGRLIQLTAGTSWDEELIEQRSISLLDSLLKVWPVPEGHVGKLADKHARSTDWVRIPHLLAASFLSSGEELVSTNRHHLDCGARVEADGQISVNGVSYESPSAAARAASGKESGNGWYYWRVRDGRRLLDVRADFLSLQ